MKISYTDLINRINRNEINVNNIWVEDENGTKWFWTVSGFATGMKEYDKEPPLIYLTDRYNIMELYDMWFEIPEFKQNLEEGKYKIKDILERFSDKDENIKLLDSKGEVWEFIPLAKSIINTDGESITEYLNEAELDMEQFEILYQKKSLNKEKTKNNLEKEIIDEIQTIEASLAHLKEMFRLYKKTE